MVNVNEHDTISQNGGKGRRWLDFRFVQQARVERTKQNCRVESATVRNYLMRRRELKGILIPVSWQNVDIFIESTRTQSCLLLRGLNSFVYSFQLFNFNTNKFDIHSFTLTYLATAMFQYTERKNQKTFSYLSTL